MAMKEIKSFSVQPSEEENMIKLWPTFGWELKGAPQEVRTQDTQVFTGQDSDGTEHYQMRQGVHYIKLTFERDPERKNYDELKSLETQYYDLKDPYYPYNKPKIFFGTLVTIICVVLWFVILCNFVDKFPLLLGVFVGLGLPVLLIFRLATYPKRRKVWKNELEEYNNELSVVNSKREEILSKAQSLV